MTIARDETTMTGDKAARQGPDFLCIGMGKAGTGWLYDQLQHHPGFWMPPIKEIHYLDRDFPRVVSAQRMLTKPRERTEQIQIQRGRRALHDRDFAFLKEAGGAKGNAMDLDFYAALFRFKDGLLSGDITPSYCTLEEETIRDVMTAFPQLKIVLLVRDPVARAWSHFSMKKRGQKVKEDELLDPQQFREMLEDSKAVRTGSPSPLAIRWLRHVPPAQFRFYFFDDLVSDPDGLKRDVLEFLGAGISDTGGAAADYNRKADKPKLEMTAASRDILVEVFGEELRAAAKLFGGHAVEWAKRYRVG